MSERTVVLVHGAWHGAWCWEPVVDALRASGVPAIAVDLPGHGADNGPFTDVHGDAARVSEVLDTITGPVVLVGHSYGGVVITEAGVHPSVEHLVYIAALNAGEGESAVACAVDEAAAAGLDHSGRPNPVDYLVPGADGTTTLTDEGAKVLLYNDCTEEQVAWATTRLCPQPVQNLTEAPSVVAWRDRPSTYIVCSRDNIVHPGLQRLLARRASASVEWDTSHSPWLSQPQLTANLLRELAQ